MVKWNGFAAKTDMIFRLMCMCVIWMLLKSSLLQTKLSSVIDIDDKTQLNSCWKPVNKTSVHSLRLQIWSNRFAKTIARLLLRWLTRRATQKVFWRNSNPFNAQIGDLNEMKHTTPGFGGLSINWLSAEAFIHFTPTECFMNNLMKLKWIKSVFFWVINIRITKSYVNNNS